MSSFEMWSTIVSLIQTITMNPFEEWSIIISFIQTITLIGTLVVALNIGLKQTKISERQAEISKSLLDIPFMVSVEVTYDPALLRLNIYNKGQTNVFLWGSKLGDGLKTFEKDPRLITPNGSYYLLADSLEKEALTTFPQNGEIRGNLYLYITSQNKTKYLITTIVFAKIISAKCTIHTQTISIEPLNSWEEQI